MLLLLLLVAGVTNTLAQDVSMSPTTGTLVAAYTQQGEIGSQAGFGATWKHQQLALTWTVSDFCNTTPGGESANPAGNMIVSNGNYAISGGGSPDCYIVVSLPKGFKFTGYEIVLLNNLGSGTLGTGSHALDLSNQNKIFYETDDLSYNSATQNMVYSEADDYEKYSAIRDAINDNDPHYLAVAKRSGDDGNVNVMKSENEGNTEYRISRTINDSKSHLYFRLSHASEAYFAVTIKSAIFYFSAEGDFTETVSTTAKTLFSGGVNYAYSPFTTSKLDLGQVTKDEYGHYTYKYFNVEDMIANNIILQSDAAPDGILPKEPGEGTIYSAFDGTNYYYALKNNTYYVECPVAAPNEGGAESPMGFRIVGARVNYTYGSQKDGSPYTIKNEYHQFYIDYHYDYYYNNYGRRHAEGNLFLDADGSAKEYTIGTNWFTEETEYTYNGRTYSSLSFVTLWFMDEDGYVRTGTNGEIYLRYTSLPTGTGSIAGLGVTTDVNEATIFKKVDTNLCFQYDKKEFYLQGRHYQGGNASFNFNSNATTSKANRVDVSSKATISTQVSVPEFTPGEYTIKIYDKTGKIKLHEKKVSSNDDNGYYDIPELNNDAIMFSIEGLTGDKKALVTVDLKMQALNPYINSLDIVCQEAELKDGVYQPKATSRSLTQTFTASNFAVRGGKFTFYVPEDYIEPCLFTFENLKSNYGDNTYWGNNTSKNYSRYSLVKSPYWDDNSDLYATSYNPDALYTTKVYSGVAGKTAFKFNNAADVAAGNAAYVVEYPFSLASYNAEDSQGNNFKQVVLGGNQTGAKTEDTAYLFTCDETRYNISPVTSTQHRYYAYYQMDIEFRKKTYTPVITKELVYSASCYNDGKSSKAITKAQYGINLSTTPEQGGAIGYLTAKQVVDGISSLLQNDGIDKDQVLYVDGSQLLSIVEDATYTVAKIKEGLGSNVIVYLPENVTSEETNCATKTSTGSFHSHGDFVITDMRPFYAKYEIAMDASKSISYERKVTVAKNGKVTSASIILPFDIKVDSKGQHKNDQAGEPVFSLHQLQKDNCLDTSGKEGSYVYAPGLSNVTTAKANTPYLVKVLQPGEGDQVSFVVMQAGSTIAATPDDMQSDYTFIGETGNGGGYTFTSHGSYSGVQLEKGSNSFYFSQNMFLLSNDYSYNGTIKVAPFRTYFATTKSSSTAKLASFGIIFDEGVGNGTTGITSVDNCPDLMVTPGNGVITISSTIDQNVRVNSTSGVLVNNAKMQAGETRTINVPAGIYVINGVKIIVK